MVWNKKKKCGEVDFFSRKPYRRIRRVAEDNMFLSLPAFSSATCLLSNLLLVKALASVVEALVLVVVVVVLLVVVAVVLVLEVVVVVVVGVLVLARVLAVVVLVLVAVLVLVLVALLVVVVVIVVITTAAGELGLLRLVGDAVDVVVDPGQDETRTALTADLGDELLGLHVVLEFVGHLLTVVGDSLGLLGLGAGEDSRREGEGNNGGELHCEGVMCFSGKMM